MIDTERQSRRASRLAGGRGATSSSTSCPATNVPIRACAVPTVPDRMDGQPSSNSQRCGKSCLVVFTRAAAQREKTRGM